MVKLSSGIELNPNELTSEDREAIVKALEETKSGVWTPKLGQTYYSIDEMEASPWETTNGDSHADRNIQSIGLAFPTREACEEHVRYLKALQVLRSDTKGYEWKYGDGYYYVYASSLVPVMKTGHSTDGAFGDVIKFKNDMDASESIVHHTKEWKIVLLGVE